MCSALMLVRDKLLADINIYVIFHYVNSVNVKKGDFFMKNFISSLIHQSKEGYIPYDRFIYEALYHPEFGYYQSKKNIFGKKGDFYTSSYVHPVFSQTLTDFMTEVASTCNLPLQICELGAGEGRFAEQVILELERRNLTYQYIVIEKSQQLRDQFYKRIETGHDHVQMFSALDELMDHQHSFEGIVFSNEFLDAQPVKVIQNKGGELVELVIMVDSRGELTEQSIACSEEIENWVTHYFIDLAEGQRAEIPVYMPSLIGDLSRLLQKGIIITVDYGYSNQEWKHPARKNGSLRGYDHHRIVEDILHKPGEIDITHHVQWDPWIAMGQEAGLNIEGIYKQYEFLIQAGMLTYLQEESSLDLFSEKHQQNRAIRTFIQGEGFANMFDVCIQTKGMEAKKLRKLLTKKPGFM